MACSRDCTVADTEAALTYVVLRGRDVKVPPAVAECWKVMVWEATQPEVRDGELNCLDMS